MAQNTPACKGCSATVCTCGPSGVVNNKTIHELLKRKKLLQIITIRVDPRTTNENIKLLAGAKRLILEADNQCRTELRDYGLKSLAGAHTMSLSGCRQITDVGISALAGISAINLTGTYVGDSGLKALSGVQNIDLSGCPNVTDTGVAALAGARNVCLYYCKQITDKGIIPLAGCESLDIRRCHQITDEGVKAHAGIHTILLGFLNITDEALKALKGVYKISIPNCPRISDEGLKALAGAKNVDLTNNAQPSITDEGVMALAGVEIISVACTGVTDKMLKVMVDAGLKVMDLRYCENITREGRFYLRDSGIQFDA